VDHILIWLDEQITSLLTWQKGTYMNVRSKFDGVNKLIDLKEEHGKEDVLVLV